MYIYLEKLKAISSRNFEMRPILTHYKRRNESLSIQRESIVIEFSDIELL